MIFGPANRFPSVEELEGHVREAEGLVRQQQSMLRAAEQNQLDREADLRTLQAQRMNRWAFYVFGALALVIAFVDLTGHGPRFEIGLTFNDTSDVYSVHDARVNWFIVAAAVTSALACVGGKSRRTQQESINVWTFFWMPFAIALVMVDLAVLSRIRDGFLLATLCMLVFCVVLAEQTLLVARVNAKKEPMFFHWWVHICTIAGWLVVMLVLWYTASWSQKHLTTPLYVIPLISVATAVLAIRLVVHTEMFLNRSDQLRWAVVRDGIGLAVLFVLLCVCAFIPL